MREEQNKVVEQDIKDVPLQYTCPAYPPIGMSMDRNYTFGKDAKGFYFKYLDEKTYSDVEYIQMLFTPKGKIWNEIIK
jgi:hypothetical protein